VAVSELLIALAIGVAFGFALERAGLGSARKLTGQFFFRDFTVLKVMFSAILTAMLGTFWLGPLGLIDFAFLYIPDTHLLPQTRRRARSSARVRAARALSRARRACRRPPAAATAPRSSRDSSRASRDRPLLRALQPFYESGGGARGRCRSCCTSPTASSCCSRRLMALAAFARRVERARRTRQRDAHASALAAERPDGAQAALAGDRGARARRGRGGGATPVTRERRARREGGPPGRRADADAARVRRRTRSSRICASASSRALDASGLAYLDYAGSSLYAESQVAAHRGAARAVGVRQSALRAPARSASTRRSTRRGASS
jgi:hypothetical protein